MPPVGLTAHGTYEAATLVSSVLGRLRPARPRKFDTALALFERSVDGAELLGSRGGHRGRRWSRR